MKFVFISVVLVCANLLFCRGRNSYRNKKVCASPGIPIRIKVDGCKGEKGEKGDTGAKGDQGIPCNCSLQDPAKPSAHIEAVDKQQVTYPGNTVIKDWSVSAPNSHLTGGMNYYQGNLTVPISGRYYIYAQIFHHSGHGRVYIRVNNNLVTMTRLPGGIHSNPSYAGGVFNLMAGDVITLLTAPWSVDIWMASIHTYFGAYLI